MTFIDHTPEVLAKLDLAGTRAKTRMGMLCVKEIRQSMRSLGPGKPGRRPHAAPGEPPAVQTGNLRRIVTYDVVGRGMGGSTRVGVPAGTEEGGYGAVLELSERNNHPYIAPVIKDKGKEMAKMYAEEMMKL